MFAAAFEASERPFSPSAMSGVYALFDDGWRSKLWLSVDPSGPVAGAMQVSTRYISYDRFRGEYPAQAAFDPEHPRLLRITVYEFNELAEQTYLGYCFAGPPALIAGVTHWREQPFGFFARRGAPLGVGHSTDRQLTAADFAGAFTLHGPHLRADVELVARGVGELAGTVRAAPSTGGSGSSTQAAVTGKVDEGVPHLARLTVLGGEEVGLRLYLFSHSFTAMAGWIERGSSTVGCYLTRYRWAS